MAKNDILFLALFLNLINCYFTQICSNIEEDNYKQIDFNTPFKFDTQPGNEVCLKYHLNPNKKYIGISFLKSNSYSVEVFIYDSYQKIKDDMGNYTSKNDSYKVGEVDYKEINVNNFNEYLYLILSEQKSYYYTDYIKIYDSSVPFELKENTPITINYFMSDKEYNFNIYSKNPITITYSAKTKGHKYVKISKGNEKIHEGLDGDDIFLAHPSSDLNEPYKINIKINSNDDKINHKFSIIYHDNIKNFIQIKENQTEQINYITNNFSNQIFFYYIKIENNFESSYTINFKLDYTDKINNYIEITTNQASSLPDDGNDYQFKDNELQYTYDRDSDEYFRFYFQPKMDKSFVLIKVAINKLNNYKIPNYFNISYSGPVTNVQIRQKSHLISAVKQIPSYLNFYIDDSKKYLFYAPYEDYCLLLKGDIFQSGLINKNYIEESSDLHEIGNDSTNFTAIIFSETKKINIIFQEYEPNDVFIENRNGRIKEAFSKTYSEEECNGKEKYIIFKYDIVFYSTGQNKYSNYWTSDGVMDIYYKNSLEGSSFFPDEKNKLEKESLYNSRTHLDIFTIKCNSPGTLYIRPYKKVFKESTHILTNNSINNMEIFLGTEIIQLYSQIKDAPPHVYFSILTFSDNEITIEPDTPGLFNEKNINGKSRVFNLVIDTKRYKMDQMAIKLSSNSNNQIEVIETTDCNYCTYQKISSEKSKKDLEINKNNFIFFIDEKMTSFSITFNNLENEEVAYGIVDLSSNDINYIPLAYNFPDIKIEKITKSIEMNLDSQIKNDTFKPYKAFIFSLAKNQTPKYKIDLKFIYKSKEKLFGIILLISLGVAAAIGIVILLILVVKKKKQKPLVVDDEYDNLDKLIA